MKLFEGTKKIDNTLLSEEEQLRIFGISSPACKMTRKILYEITKNPYMFLSKRYKRG